MGSFFGSTAYLYPWDVVGDPAAAQRVARLGVSSVTLAAAYHSVRAATPRHPGHRVVEAPSAALYLPVRQSAWAGQRLVPRDGAEWAGSDSFARARDALGEAGVGSQAWLALTHADGIALGRGSSPAALDVCATNAFGDVYSYALCPSSEEVRRYASTLTSETITLSGVESVVIEACGPMGVGHLGAHEKTSGADWSPLDEALLSLCFCAACCSAYDERGGADALRHSVRAALLRAPGAASGTITAVTPQADTTPAVTPQADTTPAGTPLAGATPPTLDESLRRALGDRAAEALLDTRRSASLALRASVLEAARAAGASSVTLHCSSDSWSTGPFSALPDDTRGLDGVVAAAWPQNSLSVAEVERIDRAAHPSVAIGAYCTVLPPTPLDVPQTVAHWSALQEAGATELHLYHAGLASDARLDLLETSLRTLAALPATESTPAKATPSPTPLSKETPHD